MENKKIADLVERVRAELGDIAHLWDAEGHAARAGAVLAAQQARPVLRDAVERAAITHPGFVWPDGHTSMDEAGALFAWRRWAAQE